MTALSRGPSWVGRRLRRRSISCDPWSSAVVVVEIRLSMSVNSRGWWGLLLSLVVLTSEVDEVNIASQSGSAP